MFWDMIGSNALIGSVSGLLNNDEITKLNILSLLAQAGRAMKNENTERALLLFGTALVAARYKRFSYAVQGALAMNDFLKKLR